MQGRLCTGIATLAAILFSVVNPAAAQNSRWGANYFPNVTLTTQDGATVHFYDDLIKGKVVAINLIYTTCKFACPARDRAARAGTEAARRSDGPRRLLLFDHHRSRTRHAGSPQGVCGEVSRRTGLAVSYRETGRYHAHQQEARFVLGRPIRPILDGHVPSLLVGNEVTGQWMRNSGVDNPKFLARTIGDWMTNWQGPKGELVRLMQMWSL